MILIYREVGKKQICHLCYLDEILIQLKNGFRAIEVSKQKISKKKKGRNMMNSNIILIVLQAIVDIIKLNR